MIEKKIILNHIKYLKEALIKKMSNKLKIWSILLVQRPIFLDDSLKKVAEISQVH